MQTVRWDDLRTGRRAPWSAALVAWLGLLVWQTLSVKGALIGLR